MNKIRKFIGDTYNEMCDQFKNSSYYYFLKYFGIEVLVMGLVFIVLYALILPENCEWVIFMFGYIYGVIISWRRCSENLRISVDLTVRDNCEKANLEIEKLIIDEVK